MKKVASLLLSVTLIVTLLLPVSNTVFGESNGSAEVYDLKTEYADNPLGIDVTKPRLSWKLQADERGQYQTAYHIQVASSESELLEGNPDVWDTGKVESDQSVNIVYEGEPLQSGKRYFWRVKVWDKHGIPSEWSEPAWWEMGLLDASDWQGEWIGYDSGKEVNPAPLIRNEFTIEKPVQRARVYVSGIGFYELSLNGEKVGDRVLDPGSTNYEKRVLYTTYDVTDQLNQGDNAIGVELGRGRYGMTTPSTWFWEQSPWHDDPKVLLQLEIEYDDGSTETIVSDESWRATDGPIRFDSLYEGEVYDARLVQDGWTSLGFDDTGWDNATKVDPPKGELHAHQHEPIKVIDTIRPKSVEEVKPGVYVFDFGVNVSGWAELTVEGPRGTVVTLIYGEKLHDDGTVNIDQGHIYAQIQTDRYILNGNGVEVWEPKFSYKGYQYVQVSGFPGEPTLDSLKGRVIHTSVASTGEFSSSEPLINQINGNLRRAFLNNLYDVLTDTPVWEKNGWTGDAQVMANTSMYNFHMPRFYTKWINDIRETQKPSGELADIAPTSGWSYDGAPGWGAVHGPTPAWDAALFEIPWQMYQHYGDERILSTVYEEMKLYFDYLASHADGHIVRLGLGDWIPPSSGGRSEGPDLTSTTYYYFFADTIANIAEILGKEEEARTYREKAADIKAAFNEEFFNAETNVYSTNRDVGYRQTSNAFPLAFGLVPEGHEEEVVANLVKDVKERGNHLNTGILGTKVLLPVLTKYGYKDIAYAVATQRTYPGWGYWIENGATALYEHWEADSRSRNHYMFGSIGEWFYAYLAGIQPGSPGYETVTIKPYMPEDLNQASGRVETVKGDVASSWEQHSNGSVTLEVEIPVNTTATVYVPADSEWAVTESGDLAHEAEGVTFVGMEDGYAVYEVGSGSYQFKVVPLSAADMLTLVDHFEDEGSIATPAAARSLKVHLTAVNRYEEKGEGEKVVKHMEGFLQLLDHQWENEWITEEVYDTLKVHTESLIARWQ